MRNLGEAFIKLTWGYPRDDGGVVVSAYQIEYKPVGSTWSAAARSEETLEQETTLWKTSKTVNLYEVRIRAINGVGFGEWSSTINAAFAGRFVIHVSLPISYVAHFCYYITLIEVPSRPLDIHDKILPHARKTYPHIHVHWNRPLDDGGLPIKKYRLEYKIISQKDWKQAKHVFTEDEKYVIKHVNKDQEYEARVAAENKMGTGKWSNVITIKYRGI